MMTLDIKFKYAMYASLFVASVASFYLSYRNYYHYEFDTDKNKSNEQVAGSETSLAELIASADLDTLNARLQLQSARMLLENDQASKAVRYYHRYEKLDSMTADLYAEIGTVMWLAKPSAASVMYFSKALKLDSVNAGALFGMGRATLQIGDRKRAKSLFQRIVQHHPNEEIAAVAKRWVTSINEMKTTQE